MAIPTGGTSLSITKGIVSRIEFTAYNYPVSGLRIQIDAAINPGNSGGPAVVGDKMIGLAFSHLGGAENIGYIIPNEEIELFLKDIADGNYDGKPAHVRRAADAGEPRAARVPEARTKVAGHRRPRARRAERPNPLKHWDVITKIGDTTIDDQGMIKSGQTCGSHSTT